MKKFKIQEPAKLTTLVDVFQANSIELRPLSALGTFSARAGFTQTCQKQGKSSFTDKAAFDSFSLRSGAPEKITSVEHLRPCLEKFWLAGIRENVLLEVIVRLRGVEPTHSWIVEAKLNRRSFTLDCVLPFPAEATFEKTQLNWVDQVRQYMNGEPADPGITMDRSLPYPHITRNGERIGRATEWGTQRVGFNVQFKGVSGQGEETPELLTRFVELLLRIDPEGRKLGIEVEWYVGFEVGQGIKFSGTELNQFIDTVCQREPSSISLRFEAWTNDAEEVFRLQGLLGGKPNLVDRDMVFCQPVGEWIDKEGKAVSIKGVFGLSLEGDGVYLIVESKNDWTAILVDMVGLEPVVKRKKKLG